MKKIILQKLADMLTSRLQTALDNQDFETFDNLMGVALWFNDFSLNFFDVSLD